MCKAFYLASNNPLPTFEQDMRYPDILVSNELWESLCTYYAEPVSIHAMVKIAWHA